jgi:Asp-tRNA(Asn)/Glu-tRNA(Gln) amidotransferase A subunit family amidase
VWNLASKLTYHSFFTLNDYKADEDCCLDIAVQSRLRSQVTDQLPMAGMRIAVKDNLDLQGLKTS